MSDDKRDGRRESSGAEQRRPSPFDPVGLQEIADRMAVSKEAVKKWRVRHPAFPRPVDLAMGPVWNWPPVEAWAEARLSLAARGERAAKS